MNWSLVAAVLLVACKGGKEPTPEPDKPAPKPTASSAAPSKPTIVGKKIVGTDIAVVRCNLPDEAAEGENHVAATRHLHRGPDNALYFFPDFKPPTRLEPTNDGCGYKFNGPTVPKKDHNFGLNPDGSFTEYPFTDESAKTKCRVRAFSDVRYGSGRLVGDYYYYKASEVLTRMNLADDKCEPEPVTFPEVPKELGTRPNIHLAGGHLLLGYAREEWKWSREVFRFDAKGTFVKKYGSADPKSSFSGDFDGCGDGLCATKYQSDLVIYDREGIEVSSTSLSKLVKLQRLLISGIVDVPDKGVYVLVGHIPDPKGKGRAELIRVDGVY